MTDPLDNRYPVDNRRYPPRRTLPAGFANLLRLHRRAAGYGIREAADIIGIDRGHLSRIERGRRCPSPEVADHIAELYRLPIAVCERLRAAAALTRAHGRSIGVRWPPFGGGVGRVLPAKRGHFSKGAWPGLGADRSWADTAGRLWRS